MEAHEKPENDPVSVIIWYIIAAMIVACTALVLLAKGVKAMPFDYIGVVGAVLFTVAALAMSRHVKRQH